MIKRLSLLLVATLCLFVGCSYPKSHNQVKHSSTSSKMELSETSDSKSSLVEFITIPSNGNVDSFQMGITEVTNTQYLVFLNEAYKEGIITYNEETEKVYNLYGNEMIYLGGSRVVKDHNKDGIFALDEMENPLNRCYIAFNADKDCFELVDPVTVDWAQYCNPELYLNVVDSINDWAELSNNKNGFYDRGDEDMQMPTLEEISNWPVTFIRWYGAMEFAKFYNYDLPTRDQWKLAASGGQNFTYATSDGKANIGSAWYNVDAPKVIHKGHVQPAKSLDPNPYGVYNLGGNVWEWTKEWAKWSEGEHFGTIDEYFIDNERIDPTINQNEPKSMQNQYKKSLIGGSFNYFTMTMSLSWDHGAYIKAGNDHFGFRVVKKSN